MKSLIIIGVGPGDPSLLTLAAVDAIKDSTVVSYPVATRESESLAEKIASRWITKDKKRLPLLFPMVLDQNVLNRSWRMAGDALMKMAEKGERVVFISQGDISLFSTGAYLAMELKKNHPNCLINLIPGVTSLSAAAAKSQFPLALQEEQLLVMPVPDAPFKLKPILVEALTMQRVVVLLKLGNKWEWVKPLLQELNLLEASIFAERVGLPDEQVVKASDLPLCSRPYFSLLMIRKNLRTIGT